jgi:predicted RND superfamily exporter protein
VVENAVDRIARFIVDHARRILAVTAIITLVATTMLFRMSFNADVTEFLLEGNATGEEFAALQEKYDTADPINIIVSLPAGETFRSKDALLELIDYRDALEATPGVAAVGTMVPEANPFTGEPLTAEAIAAAPDMAIAAALAQNPTSDLLLSDDGRRTLILVVPGDDATSLARDLDDVAAPASFDIVLSGNPVIFASVIDILGWFLLVIPPLIIGLLLFTFYATIGDRRLTILAVIPALLGSLWTFGLLFGLGIKVDIVTVIVPIFVLIMGSADGLHFVTHFQDEAGRYKDEVDRVRSALSQVGIPMILTTISTAAGFLSLLATEVRPIRQLGLFAAIGITFAGIISFFFLPALLARLHIEPSHHRALIGPRIVAGLKWLVVRPRIAGVFALALLIFGSVFVPRIEVNSDQLFFFKPNDPVRESFALAEEVFGAATPLTGEFAFDPAGGIGGLDAVAAASGDLEALPGVTQVFSVADVIPLLPAEQASAVLAGDVQLPLGKMVSEDGLRFALFTQDRTSADLQSWLDYADGSDTVRTLTGMPVLWDEIARLVVRAQIGSLIAAFALVSLLLFASYRRFKETLISLLPIALTVFALIGFIAATGIQLSLITAIVSSIVIGVGIDYTIHFFAAIDYARPEGPGYVLRAIDRAGRPIVANALGIALASTALWLSPLLPHSQISMILWFSMVVAALTALTLIPALLPRDGTAAPE